MVSPQAASKRPAEVGVLHVLEPGELVGEGAHVATSLDVVLASDRHQTRSVTADVTGEKGEIDEGEDVVGGVVMLGDPQGPADLGRLRSGVLLGEPGDDLGRDTGEVGAASQRVVVDQLGVGVEVDGCGCDELTIVQIPWMISRPMALARAMSDPTSIPSQTSAQAAVEVRLGSTAYIRAPLRMPLRTWWKKMGCASRAFEPHMTMRSVSSIS